MLLPLELFKKIQPSVDLKILRDNELLFGGLVYTVQYKDLIKVDGKTKRLVSLTVENYSIVLTRRTISGILDLEPTDPSNPSNDKNTAGRYFREIIMRLLREEGVTQGEIREGARLAEELEVYEFDTMSLKEIADVLAGLTGDEFYIDINKKLNFAVNEKKARVFKGKEYKIVEDNYNYWNFNVEKTLEGYINKIFIKGDFPDEELSEDWMDYDGRIKYWEENKEEINEMKKLNNDSGVWGTVINDNRIEHLETARRRAKIAMKKHGKMPIFIEVTTNLNVFKPGDKVLTKLSSWDINEDEFTIKRIDIQFNELNELEYKLELINNELVDENSFLDVIKQQRENIVTGSTSNISPGYGEENENGGLPNEDGDLNIQYPIPQNVSNILNNADLWIDMQDKDSIILDEYERVKNIQCKAKEEQGLIQNESHLRPWLSFKNGYRWLEFNHDEYGTDRRRVTEIDIKKTLKSVSDISSTIKGHLFIVFEDETPEDIIKGGTGQALGDGFLRSPLDEPRREYNTPTWSRIHRIRENYISTGGKLTNNYDTTRTIKASHMKYKRIFTFVECSASRGFTTFIKTLGCSHNYLSNDKNKHFYGRIAEYIFFEEELNNEEYHIVSQYLMDKYKINKYNLPSEEEIKNQNFINNFKPVTIYNDNDMLLNKIDLD